MKKIILTLIAVLCIVASASASNCQRAKLNEINVMYGFPSASLFGLGFGSALEGAIFKDVEKIGAIGTFTGEYFRYLNSGRWAFGAGLSYENIPVTYKPKVEGGQSEIKPFNCITLMPSAKVVWFNKKVVGMYSKAAAGIEIVTSKRADNTIDTTPNFAFQVNPVCVEVGGDNVRGFFELGFGAQGIAQIGVRFSL